MMELLQKALHSIANMSKEQFAQRLASAKSGSVAIALRELAELSEAKQGLWKGTFLLDPWDGVAGIKKFSKVEISSCDSGVIVIAANDERFALAA